MLSLQDECKRGNKNGKSVGVRDTGEMPVLSIDRERSVVLGSCLTNREVNLRSNLGIDALLPRGLLNPQMLWAPTRLGHLLSFRYLVG